LFYARKYQPAGIILDINLPVIDGESLLKLINNDEQLQSIPVFIISVNDPSPFMQQSAADYLVKPVKIEDMEALFTRIQQQPYKDQRQPAPPSRTLLPAAKPGVNGNSALGGKKVLLVDDDMRNIFALSALLEEKDMVVYTAENGKEAIAQLDGHTDIDIVLMDMMMPEMDGYTAMKHIRKDNRFIHLPIIAFTAKAMADDRTKCIEAGASDYISKPVDDRKLFTQMKAWL
jgi:CheY-like chemotaxis protein